ncbi:hypothetical protein EVJ58_g8714 [Rhodofomes roseus]|uniref:MIF4G domain-containing protein n=1 Tax=Rhodofomes roseus TaxID=34475 RepID=A0A4Y9XZX0_9APHY|nr:hypothetical protein EVJ58_g8714 [Rhodofomes roseus]
MRTPATPLLSSPSLSPPSTIASAIDDRPIHPATPSQIRTSRATDSAVPPPDPSKKDATASSPYAENYAAGTLEYTDPESAVILHRKVRGLLNKLTDQNFDSVSEIIITWANKSEGEHDARSLVQVIRLVYDAAVNELASTDLCARLCFKMMHKITLKAQDEGDTDAEGKPTAGGQFFRKYLMNLCQDDFERDWVAKPSATTMQSADNQGAGVGSGRDESRESAVDAGGCDAAPKTKQKGLGVVRFLGALFKELMLTERNMHDCIKKCLGNIEDHEEEEIESLCVLLNAVGQLLDTTEGRAQMDSYFAHIMELTENPKLNKRMQFLLLDVIELRKRKWLPRGQAQAASPTTTGTAAAHAPAAKKAPVNEEGHRFEERKYEIFHRGRQRPHISSCGGAVTVNTHAHAAPSSEVKSSHSEKTSKSKTMTFGPMGAFAKNKNKRSSVSLSRGPSSAFGNWMNPNPGGAEPEAVTVQPIRPRSCSASVPSGSADALEASPHPTELPLSPEPPSQPMPDEQPVLTPTPSESESSSPSTKDHPSDDASRSYMDTPSLSPVSTLPPSSPWGLRSCFYERARDKDMLPSGIDDDWPPFFNTHAVSHNSTSLTSALPLPSPVSTMPLFPMRDGHVEWQSLIASAKDRNVTLSPKVSLSSSMTKPTTEDLVPPRRGFPAKGIDTGSADAPDWLQSRSRVVHRHSNLVQPGPPATESDNEDFVVLSTSEEQVREQLSAGAKKFLESRALDKGEAILCKVPSAHRWRLVNKLVSHAVSAGVADARLVSDLFSHAASNGLCSPDDFDAGFSPTMEILDILTLRQPSALSLVAILLKGTRLKDEQLSRIVRKAVSSDSEMLLALLL